jgi:surface antigen
LCKNTDSSVPIIQTVLPTSNGTEIKEKIVKIKSSITAVAAVFSVALYFAPAANAQEKPNTKKDEKPAPVMVTINEGDTLSSIADAHNSTYVRIFNANDFISNPDVINAGQQVRIPTADEQLPDRLSSLAAVASYAPAAQPTVGKYYSTVPSRGYYVDSSGNTYYNGYCTWYAKNRRPDLPNMLGNGGQWTANAAARGYATGSAPRAGAIAESPGHVAYVESVNPNGTMVISEMNGPAGFGKVDSRTVPSSGYSYIYK